MNVHDVIDRPTQDLDCFTTDHDGVEAFVPAAVEVLSRAGYEVTVERHDPGFAQLLVVDPATGERIGVDLGVDYRLSAPVATALGPVLDLDDLAADKTLALFARALPRDFLDVDALLSRYSPERLLGLAAAKDRGFVPRHFAEALGGVRRLPAELFSLPTDEYEALVERMEHWRERILGASPRSGTDAKDLLAGFGREPPGGDLEEPSGPEPG